MSKKSHLNFFIEMANFEKSFYIKSTKDVANQMHNILQKAIISIDDFINSLDKRKKRLKLSDNFINNINNYNDFVDKQYQGYLNSSTKISESSTNFNFLYIILSSSTLYPCLFKMDTITRYPFGEFNYNNLEILKNQSEACKKIDEMLSSFIILISNTFNKLT